MHIRVPIVVRGGGSVSGTLYSTYKYSTHIVTPLGNRQGAGETTYHLSNNLYHIYDVQGADYISDNAKAIRSCIWSLK